jgi:hypothetical protein
MDLGLSQWDGRLCAELIYNGVTPPAAPNVVNSGQGCFYARF